MKKIRLSKSRGVALITEASASGQITEFNGDYDVAQFCDDLSTSA